MTLLVLRAGLVTGAVLLAIGTATTTGIAHATVLVCAGTLGVVAALVRDTTAHGATPATAPVRIVDPQPADPPTADQPSADPFTADPSTADPDTVELSTSPADVRPGDLVVGRTHDGAQVALDAGSGLVVIGHGALAEGVFVAAASALAERASTSHEVRIATADDAPHLDAVPGTVLRSGTGLRTGVAVAAVIGPDGARSASVVLVPDLGAAPRQDGPSVDVTRYGCVARADRRSPTGQRIEPVLPLLTPDQAP